MAMVHTHLLGTTTLTVGLAWHSIPGRMEMGEIAMGLPCPLFFLICPASEYKTTRVLPAFLETLGFRVLLTFALGPKP
jgi:hypothetical protein